MSLSHNGNSNVLAIIVNWNTGDLLSECLSALQKQTVPLSRIIVVDNASDDSSWKAALTETNNCELIRLDKNIGFAAANNLVIRRYANAYRWIALINPDAFVEPRWLEILLSAAKNFPEYSFFGSKLIKADSPDILDGAGDCYHVSGRVWRRGHGRRIKGTKITEPEEIFSPCAAAALYRTDALLEVDGFDEDYFCYLEDVDLGFRLRLAGHRCLYVPAAIARHRGGASTGGKHSDFAIYHGHRNLVWTYVKNMPALLFWAYLPQHLLLNLFSILYFSCRGQLKVIFEAKRDAIMKLSKMLRKRCEIQSRRKVSTFSLLRTMERGFFTSLQSF